MRPNSFSAMLASTALSLFVSYSVATAGPINSPLPANAYIVQGALEWAWAFPCPGLSACGFGAPIDLSYQGTQGWRFPTAAEFALHPLAQDFLFAGANVPVGGTDPISGATFFGGNANSDGACATPYFSSSFSWCDFGDGDSGFWAASPSEETFSEQLLVRSARAPVPEPSTLALIGMILASLATLAWVRRRPV